MYKQRLMKQAIQASKKKFNEFLLMFNENDLLAWQAFIEGPSDTPYANHIFLVKISLTSDYPIAPPKLYFKTKVFHPNIHFVTGEVCLDIIKTDWSPTWTLEALCRALLYLLQNPNADSPLNCDAANLIRLKENQAYATLAKSYSSEYAISSQTFKATVHLMIMLDYYEIANYNILTMHRPQNQSKFCESNYQEEIPFFRETITIIDQCTKLMKDDRIYLRNKIKEYLKELRENRTKEEEWENEQMQMLIQIFVQANKKKSLSKIQKGDKVMDWLQIKLRKFIDNNKKERHKKEVESFRKLKGLIPKKQNESHVYYERSLEKSREFPMYNAPKMMEQINKFAFNLETKKKNSVAKYSLGKSNQKSPVQSRRKVSQNPNSSYSQHSFYKQFEYLRKASKSKDKEETYNATASLITKNKGNLPETKTTNPISKFNKSVDINKNINKSQEKRIDHVDHHQKKVEDRERLFKNNVLQEKPTSAQLSKQQIDKLTQLFANHLNSQEEKKISHFPTQNNYIFDKPKQTRTQPLYSYKSGSVQKDISSINANMPSRYEASTSKIQEMMRNSKNILAEYQAKEQNVNKYQREIVHPQPLRAAGNQEIFTPPDFLAECRKFIFSSNKKRSEQDLRDYQPSDNFRPKTFTDILSNQAKDRSTEKVFKLNHYANQVVSQHVSTNLSTNKPNSQVHFRLKNISINNAEQLLLQIFKHSEKTVLDRFEISQISAKCNLQTQKLLRQYCDYLDKQTNIFRERLELDFVSAVKYFYTVGQIFQQNKDYFCNFICEILDIQKKDYVTYEDIQVFLESLASSNLDQDTMKDIQQLLDNIFKRSCEVQGGNLMTRWSVFYLELKGSTSILNLREHLNKFQFQIDQTDTEEV